MIPKFRAWDEENKEMLEIHGINFDAQGVWTNEMIDDESDGNFIFLSDVELLQSTGLKDKNGVEIYEGDIVKLEKGLGILREIIFKDCEFKMRTSHSEKPLNSTRKDGLIIVGNKYEHPYLLKE